jgi:alkaline phosphatase
MQIVHKSLLVSVILSLCATIGCSRRAKPTQAPPADEASAPDTSARRAAPDDEKVAAPKRIILLIGDGMGVPAITAATYAKGAPLSMLGMERMGLVTTHSYDFATTDSAAAATALATGGKTHFEGVSVAPGTTAEHEEVPSRHLGTILEKAESAGWKTGLVATVRINHATPAAFAAHRANRHSYEGIALNMAQSGVDVLIGGGRRYFNERNDSRNLLAGLKDKGYAIANSPQALAEAADSAGQVVALLNESDLPAAGDPARELSLAEMTRAAIEVLDRGNEDGFFLMVEGSQIDWRGHDLDGVGLVREMLDFDGAVQAALEYAAGRDDTLVVVTADHETGGLAVLDSVKAERMLAKLGGPTEARAMVDRPAKMEQKNPSPELLPDIQIGEYGAGTVEFAGLDELSKIPDATMRLSFGHMSLASRGICEEPVRFSATHTSAMVAAFAQGPGAEAIAASKDSATLGARLASLVGASAAPAQPSIQRAWADGKPANIILMVGDGMGVGALTAAYYARGPLAMQSLPVQGLVSTHGLDRLVNDSAAAATALATGRRTNYGAVGVAPEGDSWTSLPTLLELSEQAGMKTGLISTVAITHATPAAFYAHVPSRSQTAAIARALVELPERIAGSDGVDLVYAGGAAHFKDAQIATLRDEYGMMVETSWDASETASDAAKIMRLIAPKAMPTATTRHNDGKDSTPTLAAMTTRALERLSDGDEGFFLLVEGGQIDWAQHGLARGESLIDEMVDFDQAVRAAVDFARRDGNTLVLVTADHDHTTSVIDHHYGYNSCARAASSDFGGPFELVDIPVAAEAMGPACQTVSIKEMNANEVPCIGDDATRKSLQADFAPLNFSIQYAWVVQAAENLSDEGVAGPHAANFVPLFAIGPGAQAFEGFHDQPEVGRMLQALVKSRIHP